jgi:hypothetical protein
VQIKGSWSSPDVKSSLYLEVATITDVDNTSLISRNQEAFDPVDRGHSFLMMIDGGFSTLTFPNMDLTCSSSRESTSLVISGDARRALPFDTAVKAFLQLALLRIEKDDYIFSAAPNNILAIVGERHVHHLTFAFVTEDRFS